MTGNGRRLAPRDVLLALLAVVAAGLVVKALSANDPGRAGASTLIVASSTPSASASASPAAGSSERTARVAAYGPYALRWVGTASCEDGKAERSADGGATWQAAALPVRAVTALVVGPGGQAVARGMDASCNAAAVRSADGGATWETADPEQATAPHTWRRTDDGDVVGKDNAVPKADPCEEVGPGTAALVADAGASEAWVLCQKADGADRLLVRTQDGGATWRRLAGRREDSGLAGNGVVSVLRFAGRRVGVVVIENGGRCPGSELRRTVDGGLHWTSVACVDGVTALFDAAFGDARTGLLTGLVGNDVATLRTTDGGVTWARV